MYWATDNTTGQADIFNTLHQIAEGTDRDERIGLKVNGGWVKVKINWTFPQSWYDVRVRHVILRMKERDISKLDPTVMFAQSTNPRQVVTAWWAKQTSGMKYYKIICDKKQHYIQRDDDTGQVEALERDYEWNYSFKCPRVIEWLSNGATDYGRGHYTLCTFFSYNGPYARADSVTTEYAVQWKCTWTDP